MTGEAECKGEKHQGIREVKELSQNGESLEVRVSISPLHMAVPEQKLRRFGLCVLELGAEVLQFKALTAGCWMCPVLVSCCFVWSLVSTVWGAGLEFGSGFLVFSVVCGCWCKYGRRLTGREVARNSEWPHESLLRVH